MIGRVSLNPTPFINGIEAFTIKKIKDANNQVEVEVILTFAEIENFAHSEDQYWLWDIIPSTKTKIDGFLVLVSSKNVNASNSEQTNPFKQQKVPVQPKTPKKPKNPEEPKTPEQPMPFFFQDNFEKAKSERILSYQKKFGKK